MLRSLEHRALGLSHCRFRGSGCHYTQKYIPQTGRQGRPLFLSDMGPFVKRHRLQKRELPSVALKSKWPSPVRTASWLRGLQRILAEPPELGRRDNGLAGRRAYASLESHEAWKSFRFNSGHSSATIEKRAESRGV